MSHSAAAHFTTTTQTSTETNTTAATPVQNSNPIEPTAATPSYSTTAPVPPEGDPRRPSIQEAEAAVNEAERRGSLAPTPNPTNPNAVTTETATSEQIPPTSSVGTQNAPHLGGKVGEAVMGGFGYGGSTVERPKEEQGIAEKIVNILGA